MKWPYLATRIRFLVRGRLRTPQQQPTSLCTPEATSFLLITMPAEALYNKNNKQVCVLYDLECVSMSIAFPSSKYLCGVISLSRRYIIFLVARGGEDLGHDPVGGGIIGKTSSRFQRYFLFITSLEIKSTMWKQ